MQNLVGYGLLLPFVLFFAILFPDFITYGNIAVKANEITENAVKMAERSGGFEYSDEHGSVDLSSYIQEELEHKNLNPDAWDVEYTEGRVEYNEPLSITLRSKYTIKAFDFLWDEAKKMSIVSSKSGIGQVYFR